MRRLDVLNYTLAVVLVVASVPLYRLMLERQRASDTQLGQSPPRAVVARAHMLPEIQRGAGSDWGLVTSVECRDGYLVKHTTKGYELLSWENGHRSRCEIQAAPAHPRSSAASD